ncbi:MAG: hypothetical protein AAGH92_00030 [Planctomycetota bacterium]
MKNPVHVVLAVNPAVYGGSRLRTFDQLEFKGGMSKLRRKFVMRKAMKGYWHPGKAWVQVVEFGKESQNLHYHFVFDCAVDLQDKEQVEGFREVLQSIVDSYETGPAGPGTSPAPSLGLIKIGVPDSVDLTPRSLSRYLMKVRFREDKSGRDPQTGRIPHEIAELIKSRERWKIDHGSQQPSLTSSKKSVTPSKPRGKNRPERTIGEKVAACGQTEVKLLWEPPDSFQWLYRIAPKYQMIGHFRIGHPECSTLDRSAFPDCMLEMLRRFERREKVGLINVPTCQEADFCFRMKENDEFRREALRGATWRAEYRPDTALDHGGLAGGEHSVADQALFHGLAERESGTSAHPLTPVSTLSGAIRYEHGLPTIVVPNL